MKSKRTFKYGIAAYPKAFKETVISPQKICCQFKDLQCKTRTFGADAQDLKKTLWGTKEMPIDTQGTDIEILAVGIPIKMFPTVINQLLQAVKKHDELYPEYSVWDQIKEDLPTREVKR